MPEDIALGSTLQHARHTILPSHNGAVKLNQPPAGALSLAAPADGKSDLHHRGSSGQPAYTRKHTGGRCSRHGRAARDDRAAYRHPHRRGGPAAVGNAPQHRHAAGYFREDM